MSLFNETRSAIELSIWDTLHECRTMTPEFYQWATDDGMVWYENAFNHAVELAYRYDVPIIKVCGCMAALSIRTRWEKNLADTELVLRSIRPKGLGIRVDKCAAILKLADDCDTDDITRILNGQKIVAFFDNIYFPMMSRRVTIDTWMVQGLKLVTKNGKLDAAVYAVAEDAVQRVAMLLDELPHQTQARLWNIFRGRPSN